jgi:uncharacterized protein (TIGR03067 family)
MPAECFAAHFFNGEQSIMRKILDLPLVSFLALSLTVAVYTTANADQDEVKRDMEKLQGTWRVISSQVADEKAAEDEVARRRITVNGDLLIYEHGNEQKEKKEGTIKLDPKTNALDWICTSQGVTMLGIYELKGDDLKIGFGNDRPVQVRPKRWEIGKEDVVWLLVLKRNAKGD